METNPYKIEYVKDRYFDELERFKHLENKCGRLIVLLTIIITAFASIISLEGKEILKPNSFVDWVILLSGLFTIIAMISSWGHALLALKVKVTPLPSQSTDNLDFIYKNEGEEVFHQIYYCYADTIQELEKSTNEKADIINLSYEELAISAWALGAFSLIITLNYILT